MSVPPARRWWTAPAWPLAILTGAKSFRDNPILGSRRLNEAGLHRWRVALADRMTRRRRARLARGVDPAERARFDADGFVRRDGALPAAALAEALALIAEPLPGRVHVQGDTATRRVPLDSALLAGRPALRAFLRSASFRGLLAYAAGTRARPLLYLQTISAGVVEAERDPQTDLHRDAFYASMKAWIFLTEVRDDERPLTYVAGSHRVDPGRLEWEQAQSLDATGPVEGALTLRRWASSRGSPRVDADELAGLGLPQPTRFAVPANTLVVADTSGFHARGDADRPTVRVEIWAYVRRNPFLPFAGLSPLSWLPRREALLYRLVDRLDRWGIMKQQWTPFAARPPIAP